MNTRFRIGGLRRTASAAVTVPALVLLAGCSRGTAEEQELYDGCIKAGNGASCDSLPGAPVAPALHRLVSEHAALLIGAAVVVVIALILGAVVRRTAKAQAEQVEREREQERARAEQAAVEQARLRHEAAQRAAAEEQARAAAAEHRRRVDEAKARIRVEDL